MSSNHKMVGKASQANPPSLTSHNPLLLDKFNGRRSTPDSEALASSDDETQDHHQPTIPPHAKPTRRASWLNDTAQPNIGQQPRKNSLAGNMSPPHPSTPSAESGSWVGSHPQNGSAAGRGHAAPSAAFSWGGGIWNASESRKDPPSRLTEVLPSPTSMHPPGSLGNGYFTNEPSSFQQNLSASQNIPFAIPLHPTPKTYRSQSYSVGQLDPESPASSASGSSGVPAFSGRGRGIQHSGLHHRPCRPSMLSEMSNEGGLSKLKEVEDDDEESNGSSAHGVQLLSAEAKIDQLARENAMLRQQQQQQYQNARIRPRSSTANTFGLGNGYGLQDTVPEESEYAIDELNEINELQEITSRGLQGRRMSEFGMGQTRISPYISAAENRKMENNKKAYWHSSLGLERFADIPQSRRHSFADVPTRQGSVSSAADTLSVHDTSVQDSLSPEYQNRYQEGVGYSLNDHGEHSFTNPFQLSHYDPRMGQRLEEASMNATYSHNRVTAASYFGGPATQPRVDPYSLGYPSYGMTPYGGGGRSASPHRSMYGMPQPRQNQLLYIVLFKCSRADVFYVQEGTGLSVKPGDLVIVEADRGTDLGTVAKDNIDWATAKDMKEHYAEEHYKWLMMYSQGASGNNDGTGAGLMAASNGIQGSAVGGMGPPSQHGMQEPNPGEIKPKIIKRLAQNHEIQALRDKEGNEAKAKRVCMQKVKEHGLHMEILDAEFQMDWKKLTFFYFADIYINFNSLVTDLFKVYKTRIWMSAINPASFASPSLGLQAPSGIGPGAVGVARNTQTERRPQIEQAAFGPSQASRGYSSAHPTTQAFSPAIDRGVAPSGMPAAFQPSGYEYGYSQFGGTPRNVGVSPGGFVPMIDPFTGFGTPTDYQGLPGRFPSPHVTPTHDGDYTRHSSGLGTPNDNWIANFQGLSMNTR